MKKILSVLLACMMIAALFVPLPLAANDEKTSACPCWGDMDGDKKTTSADARLVLRQSVNLENYPDETLNRCDLDRDGKISSADARFVLRLSVNLEQYPAHELLPVVGKNATCTEDGLTDGLYCAICEKEFEPQTTIPAPGHNEVVDEAVAPTCTETGLTEGKHCSVCDTVLTEQAVVPALGHDPVVQENPSIFVCQEAQRCSRCDAELLPELQHKFPGNAAVTPEKGLTCERCGKTVIPSFNDLVNSLKQEPHVFRSFSRTDTTISDPEFKGVMVFFKSEFEKEFKENMGTDTEYVSLTDRTQVNRYTYNLVDSDKVSELKDNDVSSSKNETVNGIAFLKDLPDTFTGQYGRVSDLRDIKAKEFGDVLKVTVTLKPEDFNALKDKGGTDAIGRISTEFSDLINSAMAEFSGLNEDFLKSSCSSISTVTVSYYFDPETLQPITAEYRLNMDMTQTMSIDLSNMSGDETGIPLSLGNTGSISFKVKTDVCSYYFFEPYFD